MEQTVEQVRDAVGGRQASPGPARRRAPYVGALRLAKLGPRWPLIALAVVAGATFGLLASSGPPVYESTATVRLSVSSGDSNRVQQVAQTVEATAVSTAVLDLATQGSDTEVADLRSRTTAAWETDTDLVLVTVRGSDPDQVVAEANDVVAALGNVYDEQASAAIAELSSQGNRLLEAGQLDNEAAEQFRRQGVGSVVATEQGAAASGFTTVRSLEDAQDATVTGVSTPISMALGAFVGGTASAAAALLLPFRRRRVRTTADVALLLPGSRGIASGETGAAELVGSFLESGRTDLAIVAVGDDVVDEALYFASDLTLLLRAHGTAASIMDATDVGISEQKARANSRADVRPDHPRGKPAREGQRRRRRATDRADLSAFQFLGRSGRDETRRRNGAASLVVVAASRPETISLLSGQTDLLTAVAVRAGNRRTAELQTLLDHLRQSDPIVVLLP